MLAKRLFDLLGALAGLVLLAPLLLVLAAWIRWDTPGPVLFRQRRVGRNGVPFDIYKFRTMRPAAERAGQLSLADDGRATRAGRVLRRYKLDELPQLLNVLRGEMSLVGPRPEVPRYVAHYPPPVRQLVLSVAPGITDWAALRFRHEGDILERAADPEQAYLTRVLPLKLKYYVRYVQRRSFGGDLHILLCTAMLLLFGSDQRAPPVATRSKLAPPAAAPPIRPRLRLLRQSRMGPHDGQSLLISVVRGLAGLEVAAAHLRAQVYPGLSTVADPPLWYQTLAFFTGFAHQAVVVFFVLSGWLVGGALLDNARRPHAMRDYAIDRLTRLWMVMLPAFLLMLLLAQTGELAPTENGRDAWSVTTLAANLLGLQTLAAPVFGGNFPLWSLTNETWYYVLFPLLMVSLGSGAAGARLGATALALTVAVGVGEDILGYFLLWLAGAGASRLRVTLAPMQQWCCWGLFGLLAVGLRLRGQDGEFTSDRLPADLGYGMLFLLCLCGAGRVRSAFLRNVAELGAFFASFSFTLYVLHVPLQQVLWSYRDGAPLSPQDPASMAVYAGMLAVVVALSYLFHLPFEAQTARLRQQIRQRLSRHGRSATAASAARERG